MDAQQHPLNQARSVWRNGHHICIGFFNLGCKTHNIGEELNRGFPTGLEDVKLEDCWKDNRSKIFVESVRRLIDYRIELVYQFCEIQHQVGMLNFPSWRSCMGRDGDGVLLDLTTVSFAADICPWSYGVQITRIEFPDGLKLGSEMMAGDILGNLQSDSFKEHLDDNRIHLLENETRWDGFFGAMEDRSRGDGDLTPIRDKYFIPDLKKFTTFKDHKTVNIWVENAGIAKKASGPGDSSFHYTLEEVIAILGFLVANHHSKKVKKSCQKHLKSLLEFAPK